MTIYSISLKIRCVCPGSVTGYLPNDPNLSGTPTPTKPPDDIDCAVRLVSSDYTNFRDLYIKNLNELKLNRQLNTNRYNKIMGRINKNNGKMQYSEVFTGVSLNGDDFVKSIQNACETSSSFKGPKIGFAIVLKGGAYDNFPDLPFQF